MRAAITGVKLAGLRIAVWPVTSAAAVIPVVSANGKFQGGTIRPTPIGMYISSLSSPGSLGSACGLASLIEQLTNREREVLILIAQGRANKRIALELGISEKTVKTHVGHVLAKLDVTDRTQAAVLAVQAGLVSRS